MITSLKRKKPGAAPISKGSAKKSKTVATPTKAPVQTAFSDATTSLEHLIDRPYVQYNPSEDDITFQILECEDASKDKMALNGINSPLVDTKPSPQVRLHGCTNKGVSVVCLLQGLYPYLYFPISASFVEETDTPRLLAAIKKQKPDAQIHKMEIVTREPLMYYRPNKEKYTRFIKLYCGSTTHQNAIARILEMSDEYPGLEEMMDEGKLYDLTVYETGLAYDMRAMVDLDIVGCGWAKVPKGKWKELPKTNNAYKAPYERYGLAVVCQGKDVEGLSPTATSTDPERTKHWSKLAPLRGICLSTISLVETTGKPAITPKSKPKPDDDESLPPTYIASIAMVLTASPLSFSPFDQTLLLTHSDTDIYPLSVSSTIHTKNYNSEKEMLQGFRDFLIDYDPDLITGYDVCEEISEIIDRAKELNLPKSFPYLARPSSTSLKPRSRQTYNASWVRAQRRMAGTSNREFIELGCTGRLVLDMRTVMEKEERLRTYSLNEVSEHILGKKLELLSATVISKLLSSEKMDDKRRVADYAIERAWRMLEIMRKNASLVSAVEMARVFGLNFQEVFMGQMRRMLLFRYSNARGVIVPGNSDTSSSQMTESPLNWMPEVAYDTERPVIVLDFKSLYPSIIIARNLCFSTLLMHKNDLPPDQIHEGYGPQECYFASADVKPGVLPAMLIHLLDDRVKVKNLMKSTADASQILVLDGRQRAIKVAANAVYGATGAPSSKLQCLPIAETTIVVGAKSLILAKELIEERYSDVVDVVYGDTDSVFLKSKEKLSVPDAFELGDKISKNISEEFPDPIFLEFEKVMFPSMLVNRKRYAGLAWASPKQSTGVIDVKGIEGATRRDSVPIIAQIMTEIMALLFPSHKNNVGENIVTTDERKAIITNVQKVVKIAVRKILAGELDIGEFIMTRGLWLGTNSGDYKGKQAHIAVVDKVRKRDPRRIFKDGERVSYVLIQAPPNAKGFEKAEDPEYAITQGLSLDWSYYLDHTVKNPLSRILELLIPAKDIPSLFATTARASVKKSFAGKNNAMSAFLSAGAKSVAKCIICNNKTAPGKKLCSDHAHMESVVAAEKQAATEKLGEDFNLLDSACRSCQGNMMRNVLCTNLDCGVYFKRMRAIAEFEEATEEFEGFVSAQKLDW